MGQWLHSLSSLITINRTQRNYCCQRRKRRGPCCVVVGGNRHTPGVIPGPVCTGWIACEQDIGFLSHNQGEQVQHRGKLTQHKCDAWTSWHRTSQSRGGGGYSATVLGAFINAYNDHWPSIPSHMGIESALSSILLEAGYICFPPHYYRYIYLCNQDIRVIKSRHSFNVLICFWSEKSPSRPGFILSSLMRSASAMFLV